MAPLAENCSVPGSQDGLVHRDRLAAADDLEVGKPGRHPEGLQVGLERLDPLRHGRGPVVVDAGVGADEDGQVADDDESTFRQQVGGVGGQATPEKLAPSLDRRLKWSVRENKA